ncbi:MAG TPA: hypothetical protein VJH03_12620 [Blastocatellia bacterium]|nr:hypothetical protein [Blastocatellia bacterium]
MATIHAQLIGDKVLLLRGDLERLVEVARRSQEIDLAIEEDDTSTLAIMRLAEQGAAFNFWKEKGEDIYSTEDGEPV